MHIGSLIKRLAAFGDAPVRVMVPPGTPPGGARLAMSVQGAAEPPQARYLPIVRVHHHGHPEDFVHPDFEVELFTPAYDKTVPAGTADMPCSALASLLAKYPPERVARVGVPTDEGHHRIMDIHAVGFGQHDGPDGEPIVELTAEPWFGPDKVIRVDA